MDLARRNDRQGRQHGAKMRTKDGKEGFLDQPRTTIVKAGAGRPRRSDRASHNDHAHDDRRRKHLEAAVLLGSDSNVANPLPARPFDNIPKLTGKDKELWEQRLQQHLEQQQELEVARTEALIQARQKTEELSLLNNELGQEIVELRHKLEHFEANLLHNRPENEAEISLEIGQMHDHFIEKTTAWAHEFIAPHLSRPDQALAAATTYFQNRPAISLDRLVTVVTAHPDLLHAARHPFTDADLVIAIIMRYVHVKIFSVDLYDLASNEVKIMKQIENSLLQYVDPHRVLGEVRIWRAEAFAGLFNTPEYPAFRQNALEIRTAELSSLFDVFCPPGKQAEFLHGFQENVIEPAMKLYERIQTSIHAFTFSLDTYLQPGILETHTISPSLRPMIPHLRIKNAIPIALGGLPPLSDANNLGGPALPDERTLQRELLPLCGTTPGLTVRHVMAGDAFGEPIVIRPQGLLVAHASRSKLRHYREETGMSILGSVITERIKTTGRDAVAAGTKMASIADYWTAHNWDGRWEGAVYQADLEGLGPSGHPDGLATRMMKAAALALGRA